MAMVSLTEKNKADVAARFPPAVSPFAPEFNKLLRSFGRFLLTTNKDYFYFISLVSSHLKTLTPRSPAYKIFQMQIKRLLRAMIDSCNGKNSPTGADELFDLPDLSLIAAIMNCVLVEPEAPLSGVKLLSLEQNFDSVIKSLYTVAQNIFSNSKTTSTSTAKLLLSTYYFIALYLTHKTKFRFDKDRSTLDEYLKKWFSLYIENGTAISETVIEEIIALNRSFIQSMKRYDKQMTVDAVYPAIKGNQFNYNLLARAIDMAIYKSSDNKSRPDLVSINIANLLGLKKQREELGTELAICFTQGVPWFAYSPFNFANMVQDLKRPTCSTLPVLYIFLDVDETCISNTPKSSHLITPELLLSTVSALKDRGYDVRICFISNCLPVRDLQNELLPHFEALDGKSIPYSHCPLGWRYSKIEFIRGLRSFDVDFTDRKVFLFDDRVVADLSTCFQKKDDGFFISPFTCRPGEKNEILKAVEYLHFFARSFPYFSTPAHVERINAYVDSAYHSGKDSEYSYLTSDPNFILDFSCWLEAFALSFISKEINENKLPWSFFYISPGLLAAYFEPENFFQDQTMHTLGACTDLPPLLRSILRIGYDEGKRSSGPTVVPDIFYPESPVNYHSAATLPYQSLN